LSLHNLLLEAAIAMKNAIKKENMDEIAAANKHYDKLTCQIEIQEEKRLEITDKIVRHFKLKNRINLVKTIALLPAEYGQRLAIIRTKLKSTICELHKTNASNSILLQESLYVISKSFEIFSIASQKLNGYKRQGKKDYVKINGPIFNQVI
jgi:flagellar biosynthesis/type III secretory pathway chaperone